MCNLGIQKHFSQQKISEHHLALKKKNDQRAFALLKVLAASQTTPSQNLSEYPVLQAAIAKKKKSQ